jgi:heat shock protein HslJ
MKKSFHLLIFILFSTLSACNKDKGIILDNEWIAASITFENGDVSTPFAEYTFLLESKNQFRLQLDINLCGGTVNFRKKTVDFKDGIGCTEACCDSDFAVALVTKLTDTKYWEISNNQLILTNDSSLRIVFDKKL